MNTENEEGNDKKMNIILQRDCENELETLPRDNVEIRSTDSPCGARIFINGNELKCVREYKLEHRAGELPVLTLELSGFETTVDSKCRLFSKDFGNYFTIQ